MYQTRIGFRVEMAQPPYEKRSIFFGSGISSDSGTRTVGTITESIFSGGWEWHTSGVYFSSDQNPPDTVQRFAKIISDAIAPHLRFREEREPHYEDIYSAALQMLQDETGEISNPLISESLDSIKRQSSELLCSLDSKRCEDDGKFVFLLRRLINLINSAVRHGVSSSVPIGMSFISDVARVFESVDIFSLNHDLLIEAELERNCLSFSDGFSEENGDAKVFRGFKNSDNCGVRLIKLHGSIDWYLLRFKDFDQYAKVKDQNHGKDSSGKQLNPLDSQPMFLSGTTVKEQWYGTGLFDELFSQFKTSLSMHRRLICCGYGWGDKGINMRLEQWLRDSAENRIIVLHGSSPDRVKARRFWRLKWDRYEAINKVKIFPKWLGACTSADLKELFEN